MSEHTPGPWKVITPTAIDWRDPQVYGADGQSLVCQTYGGGPKRAVEAPEQRANARLIAAAPDLLEACKRLLHEFDPEYGDGCDLHYKETVAEVNAEILQQARAAITAATPSEARQ